jgi:hypothetical protein
LGARGAKEVLEHPFLRHMNIPKLLEKKIKAPFIPNTVNESDLIHTFES